jgi:hypothetical protein
MLGALVRAMPGDAPLAGGMQVVTSYKITKDGEYVTFPLDPDEWFALNALEIVSRKEAAG